MNASLRVCNYQRNDLNVNVSSRTQLYKIFLKSDSTQLNKIFLNGDSTQLNKIFWTETQLSWTKIFLKSDSSQLYQNNFEPRLNSVEQKYFEPRLNSTLPKYFEVRLNSAEQNIFEVRFIWIKFILTPCNSATLLPFKWISMWLYRRKRDYVRAQLINHDHITEMYHRNAILCVSNSSTIQMNRNVIVSSRMYLYAWATHQPFKMNRNVIVSSRMYLYAWATHQSFKWIVMWLCHRGCIFMREQLINMIIDWMYHRGCNCMREQLIKHDHRLNVSSRM